MSQSSSNEDQSDLWISLDEAVLRSGMPRRTILDWTKSGQVKREKRKGRVYVWVSDLATLTPLTRQEPVIEELAEPEVLPTVPSDSYGGSNIVQIKLMGDQLKENLEIQEQVLSQVTQLQSSLDKLEHQDVLDERTKKELSLLGNVFRSLHQQNEKVNMALISQKESWEQWKDEQVGRNELLDRVMQSNKRASSWMYLLVSASVVFLILIFWGFREWSVDQKHANENQAQLENDKRNLESDLEHEKLEKDKALKASASKLAEVEREHEQNVDEMESKHKQDELQSQMRYESKLQEQQDKFLSFLKEKDTKLMEQIEQQKKDFDAFQSKLDNLKAEEIKNLKEAHEKSLEELKKSEAEKWQRRESEVNTLLGELKNVQGMDKKRWEERLKELSTLVDQFQETQPKSKEGSNKALDMLKIQP